MLIKLNGKQVKLPDFFMPGAGKSGTTSLARYLAQHPEIYIPALKEPQFFAFWGVDFKNHYPKPFPYVKELDEYISLFKDANDDELIGEASTWYSIPLTAQRSIDNIKKIYGKYTENLKFIFIIRNPIERIFSAYLMYYEMGIENLPFEEAISFQVCETRINNGYRLELNYINNMLIANVIEIYFKEFPRENIKICLYEDLKEKPLWLLKDIFRFLDINDNYIPPNLGVPYNPSGIPKSPLHKLVYRLLISYNPLKPLAKKLLSEEVSYKIAHKLRKNFYIKPEIPPGVRKKLLDIFREDILKLQDLIDRDLSHWLEE